MSGISHETETESSKPAANSGKVVALESSKILAVSEAFVKFVRQLPMPVILVAAVALVPHLAGSSLVKNFLQNNNLHSPYAKVRKIASLTVKMLRI